MEFLQIFEKYENKPKNQSLNHVITKEQFEEYYNNISASIDNDQYFELMINNSWKMNDADRTYSVSWINPFDNNYSSLSNAYRAAK